jgi:hypothetical protein
MPKIATNYRPTNDQVNCSINISTQPQSDQLNDVVTADISTACKRCLQNSDQQTTKQVYVLTQLNILLRAQNRPYLKNKEYIIYLEL